MRTWLARFLGRPQERQHGSGIGQVHLTAADAGQPQPRHVVPEWPGQPESDTPDGGRVRITVDRSILRVAPDSVRFAVDLSRARFDSTERHDGLTGKRYKNAYAPHLHNLVFLWDMGEDGQWSAPRNVLPTWREKRYAKGPCVAHMYTRPGIYTVRLTVLEPHTGKMAVAEPVDIVVQDPNQRFPGTRTICINPPGDNDFSGAPQDALKVHADVFNNQHPAWAGQQKGPAKRWLFKRGARFRVGIKAHAASSDGHYFGAYGRGPRPICEGWPDGVIFAMHGFGDARTKDLRIINLDMRGGFKPARGTVQNDTKSANQAVFFVHNAIDVMMSGCHMSGFRSQTIAGWATKKRKAVSHVHLDDCEITEFGGQYAVMVGPYLSGRSWVSFTGTCIAQDPDASANDHDLRSPIRSNGAKYTHLRGCDLFHTKEAWPCILLDNDPMLRKPVHGNIVNMHSCCCETGDGPIGINNNLANVRGGGVIVNAIIDGCVVIGNRVTNSFVRTMGQGVTVRNCLGVQPAIPVAPEPYEKARGGAFLAAVWAARDGEAPTTQVAPIRSYNNTWVVLRDKAQNNGRAVQSLRNAPRRQFSDNGAFEDVTSHNNVLYAPELDLQTRKLGPLSSVALPITPRTKGVRPLQDFKLQRRYAPPPGPIASFAPRPGSALLGAALTEPAAVRQLDLFPREMDPPSMGAWEGTSR